MHGDKPTIFCFRFIAFIFHLLTLSVMVPLKWKFIVAFFIIGRGFESFFELSVMLLQCKKKSFIFSVFFALTHFSTFPISFLNFYFYLFNILICTWEMEIICVLIINDWGTFHVKIFKYKLMLKFDKLLIPRNWKEERRIWVDLVENFFVLPRL